MNWLVPLLVKVLARLPLSWLRALGFGLSNIAWWLNLRLVSHSQDNIAHCLPELSAEEQRQLAKKSMQSSITTVLEAGFIWCRSWETLERKIIRREGEVLLRAKIATGKGVVVLSPHLGNWEVVGPYLASLARLTVMYQQFNNTDIDTLVFNGRSKLNIDMAPANRRGVLKFIKALDQGGMIGVLPDHVPDKKSGSQLAPFFNQPAVTMILVHGLVQRTGCSVCCCVAERVAGGFAIHVLEADPRIYSEDINESTQGLNASVEACIRLMPAQYQWGYKRFRHLPAPLANIYRR